ncbi:MAG: tail fiber domain-containing protein [Bdellovibrionaceae bacterium]|nr:tail fiber domain-containing protein [Pseudobdellovibrionaceae bacterium]
MTWQMKVKTLFFLFIFFLTMDSFASNPGVSYQGRIFKPDGNALEGTSVQFRMQVRSPGSENCLLYEEVQTLNMAGSSGIFSLTINDGTGTRLDAATYQVDRIFANRGTMTLDSSSCATGTDYTPNSSDGRKLIVYFKDETMAAYEAMPIMNLNYVPQAMYALEAQKVGTFAVNNILRAVDGSGNPVAAPALNPTQLTNLNTLLATPAANFVQTTSNGSAALPVVAGNPSSGLAAGQIWYDSGSNVMKYYDGAVKTFGTSGGGVTSVATGTGLTGGPITTTGTINVDVGTTTGKIVQVAAGNKLPAIDGSDLTNITATDATKLPLAGGTMTGPLVNNSNSASTALAVTQSGAGYAASFMGGNVGVGTTAPSQKLHISSSSGASDILLDRAAGNEGVIGIRTGTSMRWAFGSNSAAESGSNAGSNFVITSFDDSGTIPSFPLTILRATGNVGIGTATPGSPLDVLANSSTPNTNFVGVNSLARYTPSAASSGSVYAVKAKASLSNTGGNYTGSLTGVYAEAERTTSAYADSTMIGVDARVSNSTGIDQVANSYGVKSRISSTTGVANILTNSYGFYSSMSASGTDGITNGYAFYAGSLSNVTNKWSFYASDATAPSYFAGNVGIGTTSPTDKLDVIGGARVSGDFNVDMGTLYVDSTNNRIGINTIPSAKLSIQAAGNTSTTESLSVLNSLANPMFLVRDDGNVGIGVTGPTSKLQVAGDITPDTTASKNLGSGSLRWNNIYLSNAPDVSSDARLKKDVQTSDLGLDFINSLRPVSWTWKDANQGTTEHYGVIAQETESAIAKAKGNNSSNVIVTHNEETDSYSVRYTELISPIIKAVQELYNKLVGIDRDIASIKLQKADQEALNAVKAESDAKIKQLESENKTKDRKIQSLEQENEAIKARLEKIEKALNSK